SPATDVRLAGMRIPRRQLPSASSLQHTRRAGLDRGGLLAALLLVTLAACAGKSPLQSDASAAPTATAPTSTWRLGNQAMVAAADRRAVEAGLQALREDGSAVDAAIAVHAVLGLVEPQSSGIGGGGYMVVHDRARGVTLTSDGRETARAAATADYFSVDGQNLGFLQAIQSGRSVGVPGTIALYKAAHDRHGRLPWARNFEAAIRLAEEG